MESNDIQALVDFFAIIMNKQTIQFFSRHDIEIIEWFDPVLFFALQ